MDVDLSWWVSCLGWCASCSCSWCREGGGVKIDDAAEGWRQLPISTRSGVGSWWNDVNQRGDCAVLCHSVLRLFIHPTWSATVSDRVKPTISFLLLQSENISLSTMSCFTYLNLCPWLCLVLLEIWPSDVGELKTCLKIIATNFK